MIVQSCSALSHSTKVGDMVFRELNNSLIFLFFSPVALNISSSFEKCFHSSLYHHHILIFDVANFGFKLLWYCQIYLPTLPTCHLTSMFFLATRKVVLVVHTTRGTRIVTHTQSRYIWLIHGVKTCTDTFNHCVSHRKRCIIHSFK